MTARPPTPVLGSPGSLGARLEALLDTPPAPEATAALAEDLATGPVTTERLLEVAGVLRARALPVSTPPNRVLVDVADAGADVHGLLDAAAAAAVLVAACDGTVAHHAFGPPRAGGAALLHALGLPVALDPKRAAAALDWCGFAVLPGDRHHPSLGRLAPLLLGAPRFFALLGPLLNPACPTRQFVGVDDPAVAGPLVEALRACGADAALVVSCGGTPFLRPDADALGELWMDGKRSTFRLAAKPSGRAPIVSAGIAADAAKLAETLAGARGPLAEAMALTAGAALWVGGVLPTLVDGRVWAADRLSQGVDLADVGGPKGAKAAPAPTSQTSRTAPASASTSPRTPRPPRAPARPGRGRKE